MTQDHAIPVPPRAPMVVRAGTEAGPAAVPPVPDASTGPGTEPVLVPVAPVPMSVPERTHRSVSRWAGTAAEAARELWFLPGRLLHVILHGKAETMAEHRDYVESRAWVPDGMSEAAEKAVTIAGLLHYLIVARSVKSSMKAVKFAAEKIDHAADRAVSFYIATAIVTALIVPLVL